MKNEQKIIDVWMQHPNANFINHDMFASLRRWMGIDKVTEEIPLEMTMSAMDEGQVQKGLICAWWGPGGELISNDEVAVSVKRFPDRFVGVGSVNLYKPMDAVREVKRCVNKLKFKGIR